MRIQMPLAELIGIASVKREPEGEVARLHRTRCKRRSCALPRPPACTVANRAKNSVTLISGNSRLISVVNASMRHEKYSGVSLQALVEPTHCAAHLRDFRRVFPPLSQRVDGTSLFRVSSSPPCNQRVIIPVIFAAVICVALVRARA